MTRRIALSGPAGKGKVALVDNRDYALVMAISLRWWLTTSKSGRYQYARAWSSEDGKKIRMHRVILGSPKGQDIHHLDDDGLNNCRNNLCVCSHSENMQRQRKQQGRSSRFRGVSWHKRQKRWVGQIKLDGKRKWLGSFTSESAATRAYDVAAQELFGKFARLNE